MRGSLAENNVGGITLGSVLNMNVADEILKGSTHEQHSHHIKSNNDKVFQIVFFRQLCWFFHGFIVSEHLLYKMVSFYVRFDQHLV